MCVYILFIKFVNYSTFYSYAHIGYSLHVAIYIRRKGPCYI